MQEKKHCYAYILECGDGTLYTGWTTDLKRRLSEHNAGKGAKYTRSRKPVKLRYYEEFGTKEEAMRREAAIKRLSRRDKLNLILNHIPIHTDEVADTAQHNKEMKNLM